MAMNYPDCKDKDSLENGYSFQDFVCIELAKESIILQNILSKKFQYQIGENLQGWEIKLDREFLKTGRLSIEIAEKIRADISYWTPSGIYRNDNSWLYIQGNFECFFIFGKKFLINLHNVKNGNGDKKYKEGEIPTLKKFYLPLIDAEKYCLKKWSKQWKDFNEK